MLSETALAMNREQTRALLLKSLYRANVRQTAVARRRTTLRYFLRVVRRCVTAVVATAGLLWGAMAMGLLPQVRIVRVHQLQAEGPPSVRVVIEPSTAVQSAIDAGPLPSAMSTQRQSHLGGALGTEDQALPIELKLDSQLNSLMQ